MMISAWIARYSMKQKIIGTLVIVAIGSSGGYTLFANRLSPPQYVTTPATRGTLTVSVSGSGQVSAVNQIDVKPQAAGTVVQVLVAAGQKVKENEPLVRIDARDALKAVRDAEINLESTRLTLKKLLQATDELSLLQSQNSVQAAKDSLEKLKLSQQTARENARDTQTKSEDDMGKYQDDTYSAVANAFLDLPGILTGLNDVLHGTSIGDADASLGGKGQKNATTLINSTSSQEQPKIIAAATLAETDYALARVKYDAVFEKYKTVNRFAEQSVIEAILAETIDAAKIVAQASKSASGLFDAWVDARTLHNVSIPTTVKSAQSNLAGYTSKVNAHISAMVNVQTNLKNAREAKKSAERDLEHMSANHPRELAAAEATIKERESSLAKLEKGADQLDIQSAQLSVRQRESSLSDARVKLGEYTLRAPIAGTVAKIAMKKKDQASSGATAVTIMADKKLAEISLNEVDVTRIKIGQKATLTFDAIPEYSLTGEVAEIDSLGTVSQGVVSYNVKVIFDTQDDRVKPGMSAAVTVIIDVRTDALLVPVSAVQEQNGVSIVNTLDHTHALVAHRVTTGVSNEIFVELASGDIKVGDEVVTQIITAQDASAAQQRSGGIPFLGGAGGGGARGFGGAVRAGGR